MNGEVISSPFLTLLSRFEQDCFLLFNNMKRLRFLREPNSLINLDMSFITYIICVNIEGGKKTLKQQLLEKSRRILVGFLAALIMVKK
ncbi:MAG: hypothetical protein BAW33_02245 [Desulfobacterales bacterium C00003104]|nr:MAG: hypothetical protein BAW33_02245 [Desulfobacterales bacterium C00003104]